MFYWDGVTRRRCTTTEDTVKRFIGMGEDLPGRRRLPEWGVIGVGIPGWGLTVRATGRMGSNCVGYLGEGDVTGKETFPVLPFDCYCNVCRVQLEYLYIC